jgi:hypothetical protein
VLLAVNVSTLVEVVGLVPYATVTPPGRPVAASVTLPVNGLMSVTVMVSVAVLPWVTDRVDAEGAIVKLPVDETTVSAMVVFAVVLPEVPVMVTVAAPTVAVLLAVSVSTLELVDDVGLNEAITPLGSPVAVNDTLPVNPPTSATVMVSVPVLPCATDREVGEGVSVKPGVVEALTVRVMVVVAVRVPEVPLMVTVAAPTVAVLLAVSVSTLELVDDVGLNEAVTPLGRPDAVNVTLPVNGLTSVTVMVSVPLLPWVTDSVDAEGVSVKPGDVVDPLMLQDVLFSRNDVGIAFVRLFQVPLNPKLL